MFVEEAWIIFYVPAYEILTSDNFCRQLCNKKAVLASLEICECQRKQNKRIFNKFEFPELSIFSIDIKQNCIWGIFPI